MNGKRYRSILRDSFFLLAGVVIWLRKLSHRNSKKH